MPTIAYQVNRLRPEALAKIETANQIIAEYRAQGLDLTLRQLYYQFVARGLIPNNEREYKNLGTVIANGRMVGLIDWDAITDRTRYVRKLSHWDSPREIVEVCAEQYRIDKWYRQPIYTEVWIEKDALIGVIEGICQEHDVPYLACRGYASASEVWNAGYRRIRPRVEAGKQVIVFYLGDHDPSGIDMSRDVQERLCEFAHATEEQVQVHRLALNMDQVERYTPPPNPTKMTDSRAGWYVDKFGEECWELDALNPTVIRDLVDRAIKKYRDKKLWEAAIAEEEEGKARLLDVAQEL